MIKLKDKKCASKNLWEIVTDYEDLLFYDEPILWTGKNVFGTRVLASSIDEDDKKKIEQHFYILVDDEVYEKFIKKEIDYLSILKNASYKGLLFLIERQYQNKWIDSFYIKLSEIPKEYLPLKDSYYKEEWKEDNTNVGNN